MSLTALLWHYPSHTLGMLVGQAVRLTKDGAAHFNEAMSVDFLQGGEIVGYLMPLPQGTRVYSAHRAELGYAQNKHTAVVQLTELYVSQTAHKLRQGNKPH